MTHKAVITCALTGVLTDPSRHPVPVTPAQMAAEARSAYDAGASILHIHFRRQQPGKGHLPSWEPQVAQEIAEAIRDACPGVLLNFTTGVVGRDQSGPLACLERCRPEIAACNAGSLNYLKVTSEGNWAWPPMLFDNPADKVEEMVDRCNRWHIRPEFECFDLGIVRSVAMYQQVGMVAKPNYNLVMGVASGMPADPDLLPLLQRYMLPDTLWQSTVIGRQEIWPVHRKTAELGGHLRTGLEDSFYLPDGRKARGNGEMIAALATLAEQAGRSVASPEEARAIYL
ncbi:3-keto-5-aminohexanoate cleavage protein [Ferrimonas sp. YFM]|uniref:3-keto-5-aminohexanoate cleavage protein n=1 Tax=Ferrimonas sp. YFM TaxID=3028878 RepID=UPI0025726A54|nr:3-keto-5-aminohexanoate cleavage protein [Ferrimonas sp. YFM]BDY05065.1 3-keto-5-aminohexanoate cleavage protein [Ferrimonas sp. YFM]